MALVECEECGNQVSDKAQACPKCGAPVADASKPSIEEEERLRAEVRAQAEEEARQKIEAEKAAKAQKNFQKGCLGCLGCLGIIVVLVIVGSLLPDSDSGSKRSGGSAPVSAAGRADCRLKDGPMTIFRSGTLDKVYALGKENYAMAVILYAACASVPHGTKLGIVDGAFLTSTVIVKEGKHLGCTGDIANEFIDCE